MMNQANVMGSGRHDLDIFHVRLASGETRMLSLDELAEAFNEGWIDEQTPVLRAGAIHWAPLGEVAGLDDSPSPAQDEPPSMPNSIAPLSLDTYGSDLRFDLDVPIDAESDAEVQAFRPRRGKKILGVMTALVVMAGLGFAGFKGRPMLQRTLASKGAAKTTAIATPAAQPPAPIAAPPAPPAPAPAPAVAPETLPTLTASTLPNAPQTAAEKKAAAEAEKKAAAEARKAKKAPAKR